MQFRYGFRFIYLTILSLFIWAPILAQQNEDVAKRLSANAEALRQYGWTTRLEVRLQGQQQATTVEMFRYDLDGKLQITSLGGSGQLSEEMRQAVDKLVRLGFSYTQPDPEDFQDWFKSASIWLGTGDLASTTRIEGENFVRSDDFTDIRTKNDRADTLKASSNLRDIPVEVQAEFRALPNDGPSYVARLSIFVPSHNAEVIVENFDYIYNAPVAATDISILSIGTEIMVRIAQPLASDKNKPGDTFEAIIDRDVTINGKTAISSGTTVNGLIAHSKESGRAKGRAQMHLTLTSLVSDSGESIPIEVNLLEFEADGTGGKDAARIGAAAGIGALIGAIADGGSGALIGATIGAGAGTGATLLTKGKEVQFQAEQVFSFNLVKELRIGR